MQKALQGFARLAALTAAVGMAAIGCAGDVGDIDRVQPGYVTKADLTSSSWYYRRTVVDAPETLGPYASVGTGDLFTIERIRWDIQEDFLIAYRDYEWTPGADNGEDPGADYVGTPAAAFPITGHFDIIREYNAETGEETNVISENTTDLQWFEREFMRVDWSKNANPNIDFIIPVDFLDLNGVGGGNFYVHEDDAVNPWRARIEPDNGYLDFVVNHFVVPDPATCYYEYDFTIWDAYNCGAGEIRVRHAFMKVDDDENSGYSPLWYPDSVTLTDAAGKDQFDPSTGGVKREGIFDRFGYYRLEKLTYDNERGLTESGRLHRILRFNIWEKSVDANNVEIPYAQRVPKPIDYYLNWDFPPELVGTAMEVADEWNDVFKGTVASLQNKDVSQVPDMFRLFRNSCNLSTLNNYLGAHTDLRYDVIAEIGGEPNLENLDNWCAATEYYSQDFKDRFTWQQIGDPRINMMYWITHITPAAFAGYGPMLADPISGRIVTSTAYIMGWTIESAAQRALEYIDYINGELSLTDILVGSNAPEMLTEGSFSYNKEATQWSIEDVAKMANKMVSPEHLAGLKQKMQNLGGTHQERMTPIENSAHFAERLARIRGTDLERDYLTRPEDLMLASRGEWVPGMPVSDELYDQASFINRIQGIQDRRDRTNRLLQERTMCPTADLDGALVGLAKKLKRLPRAERREILRRAVFKAVMLHEVGHNVGLRHNFEGSYDSLNYHPQFWDLEATDLSASDKLDAQQPEFMYSSIMDYHGKTNGDFQGLGAYDNAAIKFGYGQLLEKFNDASLKGRGGKAMKSWMWEHDYREFVHNANIDGHDDAHAPYFTSVLQPTKTERAAAVGKMFDRSDFTWDWRATTKQTQVDALMQDEVPYMFCSDEYAGYTPTCKRFDFGANQRELQASAYVRYKNYFIFTNYLRYKLVLNWNRVLSRGYTTFRDTTMTYQYMYLYSSKDDNFQEGTDLGADMATSVAGGLNLMSEVLAMPRPTTYFRCVDNPALPNQDVTYYTGGYIRSDPLVDVTAGTGPQGEACNMDAELDLPVGSAFPLYFGFGEEYVTWTFTYLGMYWDKLFALQLMTDPYAFFFRENQAEDLRSYSVSLYRLYPDEVNDVLLNLIEFNRKGIASYYNESDGTVDPRPMIDLGTDFTQPKIVPSLARNLQLYSVLYGMAFLTSPLDETLDFAKHTRIALKGSPEDFTVFDDVNSVIAECTLPEAGRTYRGIQTASAGSRIDIGYNFVQQCSNQVTALGGAKTIYDVAKLAVTNSDVTQPDWVDLNRASDDARRDWERANSELRETEQMLLFMRDVNRVYEYGVGY